jgi:hypothetical protein
VNVGKRRGGEAARRRQKLSAENAKNQNSALCARKHLISLKTAKENPNYFLGKVWKSLEFPWKSLDLPWKGLEKFGALIALVVGSV